MLPRKNRVPKAFFEEILGKSLCVHTPLFSFRFKRLNQNTESSFAVVVSKKVAKTAVERNLLKRRIKSIVQDFLKNNPKKEKLNLGGIFFLKKGVEKTKFFDLKAEVQRVIIDTLK